MGGKHATSTSKVTIPPEVLARYNAVNARAEKVAETPYEKFGTAPTDFVAQMNEQQAAGTSTINTAGGPAYEGIDKYMSPYIRNVADTTGAMMRQQQEQAQSGALGTAISSGAFGGDRAGIAAANLQQQNALGYGKTMADIMNQGYTQALGASQADLGRKLQAGQMQLAAGTMQQQTEQAGKDAMINQFMQEKGYPFQVAQYLANIAMGTGALSGSTTTSTQPTSFFASGGRVHKEGGGGVAGPYGAQVGSQPFMEGYIPQAFLPVGELMMADAALADQSSQSNADYINQMLQMGQTLKGLTAEGKAYGGGVDAPNSARSYLSDVIDSQKKENKPDLMTARQPDGQKGGGLGETLGNVAKILSFFKDGGVVGRHGYYDGGAPSRPSEDELLRRSITLGVDPRFADAARAAAATGVSEISGPPRAANLGADQSVVDMGRASAASGVPEIPSPLGKRYLGDAAPLTSPRPQGRTSADASAVAADTMAALDAPTGLAPLTSPRPQQPYSAGLPSEVTNDTEFMGGVRGLSQKYGVSEGDILRLMNAESGIDPSIQNSIGATGLIQFTPQTAANLGTSPKALAGMSRSEQLPFVDQYLGGTKLSGVENPTFNDLYASVLWPAAVGKPDDTVLFSKGSEAYRGNAPLDLNQDGDVTKGEAGTWARNKGVGVPSVSVRPSGLAGADMSAEPQGVGKSYKDRGALGQLLFDPQTNKLSQDALLSILSGIGTMASSPSRFLGSAVLQGIGGAANTFADLRQKAPERIAKNLENANAFMSQYERAKALGYVGTPEQYAGDIGYKGPVSTGGLGASASGETFNGVPLDPFGRGMSMQTTVDVNGRPVQVMAGQTYGYLKALETSLASAVSLGITGAADTLAQVQSALANHKGQIVLQDGTSIPDPTYEGAAFGSTQMQGDLAQTADIQTNLPASMRDAQEAQRNTAELGKALAMMPSTGTLSGWFSKFGNIGQQLGFDVDTSAAEGYDIASKVIAENARSAVNSLAGKVDTSMLGDLIQATTPGPNMTPGAIEEILAIQAGIADYNLALASARMEAQRAGVGNLAEVERDFVRTNTPASFIEARRDDFAGTIKRPAQASYTADNAPDGSKSTYKKNGVDVPITKINGVWVED